MCMHMPIRAYMCMPMPMLASRKACVRNGPGRKVTCFKWKLQLPPPVLLYVDGRGGFAPEAAFSCSRSLSEAASAPLTSSLKG